MFNDNTPLLRGRVTMVTLKSCNLIGRSKILEHVDDFYYNKYAHAL
jgi:hypothetical protein